MAIALVVLYHGIYWSQTSQPGHLTNTITQLTLFGWLGVNLFFVLSGFLITGILLDSKERAGYFSNFYIRRVLRILPVYFLIIGVLLALRMLSGGGVFLSLTFLANYHLIPGAVMYGPFWSLSVEEQFYLVWPVVVLFTGRRTLTWIAAALCVLEPALRAIAEYHTPGTGLTHGATFLIGDNLALGALGAIFIRSRYGTRRNALLAAGGLLLAAAAVLAAGMPFGLLHRTNVVGSALQTVPFNFIFAAMLVGSLTLRGSTFAGPVFLPLRWLGDISYGLYLIHLIVFAQFDRFFPFPATYYGHFGALLGRFAICMGISMLLAWLSRRFYEEPFLKLKSRLAPRKQPAVPPLADAPQEAQASGVVSEELQNAGS
jgi:peptidoglycan/LPS O-acetylase OafA/YrhL